AVVGGHCGDRLFDAGFPPALLGLMGSGYSRRSGVNRLLGCLGVVSGNRGKCAEQRLSGDCPRHVSAASADADSENWRASNTPVAMQRGCGGADVRDLRCGILELARTSGTLTEIAVIEREGDESALGKGAGPGAGCLLLHAGQGSG